MTTCLPNNAPTQFGKFHCLSKPSAILTQSTSVGWGTYSCFIVFQITSHVFATIRATVACPNRQLNAIVWYESPVAKNLKKILTSARIMEAKPAMRLWGRLWSLPSFSPLCSHPRLKPVEAPFRITMLMARVVSGGIAVVEDCPDCMLVSFHIRRILHNGIPVVL